MDTAAAASTCEKFWEAEAVPTLTDYIRIPCLSPGFAADWAELGHIADAVSLLRSWAAARPLDGITVEVVQLDGHTPVLVCEVPAVGGRDDDTVLLYGHLDKQPEFTGWREGLGPWNPVREGDRLYGRGAADDGYSLFAALGAIEAARAAGGSHARCVVVIEACEESGSVDLGAYMEALADRLGSVSLVVCLDSGAETWDRLWVTNSLRGLLAVEVRVEVLEAGLHSGTGSGVVPSSFRILRQLMSRLEDETTGEILLPDLYVDVPADRAREIEAAAAHLTPDHLLHGAHPVDGLELLGDGDTATMLRNRSWRPALATTGIDGVPPMAAAGNVLRPFTSAKLSFRLPPTCDSSFAAATVRTALTDDPPYGARITVTSEGADGWSAPPLQPWLAEAIEAGSEAGFGEPARFVGEGGSIPFMKMLGDRYPEAQFLVTGVLGPGSNAHGPDEYLDVAMAKGVTVAVANVLDAHARRAPAQVG
jgi:acetylornithine deacetylase/succinyl-diaminopimelate desuccinylase-like protein